MHLDLFQQAVMSKNMSRLEHRADNGLGQLPKLVKVPTTLSYGRLQGSSGYSRGLDSLTNSVSFKGGLRSSGKHSNILMNDGIGAHGQREIKVNDSLTSIDYENGFMTIP